MQLAENPDVDATGAPGPGVTQGLPSAAAWTRALPLGIAVFSAIGVSRLPQDLLFMLPAILVVWAGVFAALRARNGLPRLSSWIAAPCWIWLLALAANPLWSAWPQMSIWFGLVFALIPASVLGLHRVLADDRVWNRLEWLVFGAGALVAATMLYQYFAFGLRADGPFIDANVASAALYAVLLPLLYRLIVAVDRGPSAWLAAVLAFIMAAGFFTGFSRAGAATLAIALAGTAIVMAVAGRRAMRWRFAGCLVLVALAYTVVYFGPQQPHKRTFGDLSSLEARFLMWESTLDIYADAPVLGHGLGTYKILYPRYRSLAETGTTGDMAHNDYLQLLAEGGPLLMALLAGFLVCVLCAGLRLLWRARGDPPGEEKSVRVRDLGLCAAILALCVHATMNFIFYGAFLTLLAGLYAARLAGHHAVTRRRLHNGPAWDPLRRIVRPVLAVAAVFSLVTVATGAASYGMLQTGPAGGPDYASENNADYRLAVAISHINPLAYRARFYAARAEAVTAAGLGTGDTGTRLAVMALQDMNGLLGIKRPDCSIQTSKGTLLHKFRSRAAVLRRKGVWQDPAAVLQRTVTANPTCMPAWQELAGIWADRGHVPRAIAVLEQAAAWVQIDTVKRDAAAELFVQLAKYTAHVGNTEQALRILRDVLANVPDFGAALSLRARLRASVAPRVHRN